MAFPRLASALLCAVIGVTAAPAWSQQGPASTLYCCENAQGRRVCGDVLPAECFGREYRELGAHGVLRRIVPAPMTREQIAKREADEKRRKEEAARIAEENLADQILIDTYTGLADIDARENQALQAIDSAVEGARSGVEALLKQRKRYEEEAEFYVGRQLPRSVESGMKAIDAELASIEALAAQREKEKIAVRERFAIDRKRYKELVDAGRARP